MKQKTHFAFSSGASLKIVSLGYGCSGGPAADALDIDAEVDVIAVLRSNWTFRINEYRGLKCIFKMMIT